MDVLINANETDTENIRQTTIAKGVAMSALFIGSFILGILPIKLSRWFKWQNDANKNIYVEVLLCMGGGILLCTTFLHLLPEVEEGVRHFEVLKSLNLPIPQLLMCCGFFAMYFVEECLHLYIHRKEKKHKVERKELVEGKEVVEKGGEEKIHIHEESGHSHVVDPEVMNGLRGLLIILGLSIHELFEGLSVGLESSATNVWYMFGAVSAHKLVIAFCIGVELVTSNLKNGLIIVYVLTFAIVSPLGIGIGIALSLGGKSIYNVPSVILQGLATGTLLYIVFFEILKSERKSGMKKYFAVLIGFVIMCAMSKI